MIKKHLFVEGEEDDKFFRSLSRKLSINDLCVKGDPPTKGKAIDAFLAVLKSLTEASSDRVGLVIDADFIENGGGLEKTKNMLNERLVDIGWQRLNKSEDGFCVRHLSKVGNKVGVWIMPDNLSDGYFEGMILEVVAPCQRSLVAHASKEVDALMKGGKRLPPFLSNLIIKKNHRLGLGLLGVILLGCPSGRHLIKIL